MCILEQTHFFHNLWADLNRTPRIKDGVEMRHFHIYWHKNKITEDLWKLSLRKSRHLLVSYRNLWDVGEICVRFGLSFIQIGGFFFFFPRVNPTDSRWKGLVWILFGRLLGRNPYALWHWLELFFRHTQVKFLAGMWANSLPRKAPAVKPSLAMNL